MRIVTFCIGARNQVPFIIFVFTLCLLHILITLASVQFTLALVEKYSFETFWQVFIVRYPIVLVLNVAYFFAGLGIWPLTGVHIAGILRNTTSNERMFPDRYKYFFRASHGMMVNAFDQGIIANVREFFTTSPVYWEDLTELQTTPFTKAQCARLHIECPAIVSQQTPATTESAQHKCASQSCKH